jgi:hypothetical protein
MRKIFSHPTDPHIKRSVLRSAFHCTFFVFINTGILEIGHDYFQTSRDRCDSELLLETLTLTLTFFKKDVFSTQY